MCVCVCVKGVFVCVGGRTHERVLHGADGHGPPGVVVLEEGVVHLRQPASFFQHSALSRALSLTHTLSLRHAHTDTLDTHTHTPCKHTHTHKPTHTLHTNTYTRTYTHTRTHHTHSGPRGVEVREGVVCPRQSAPLSQHSALPLSFSFSYTHTHTPSFQPTALSTQPFAATDDNSSAEIDSTANLAAPPIDPGQAHS